MQDLKGKHRVLIVDDDELLLAAMQKKLELAGYEVTTSTSVLDAYFKIEQIKPDIVLLDVIMPDINGLEFINLINSQLLEVQVPIILMSSMSKEELFEKGYKFGAARYLAKPFEINDLPRILEQSFSDSK